MHTQLDSYIQIEIKIRFKYIFTFIYFLTIYIQLYNMFFEMYTQVTSALERSVYYFSMLIIFKLIAKCITIILQSQASSAIQCYALKKNKRTFILLSSIFYFGTKMKIKSTSMCFLPLLKEIVIRRKKYKQRQQKPAKLLGKAMQLTISEDHVGLIVIDTTFLRI